MLGIGSGLVITAHSTLGGTSVIARIISKYSEIKDVTSTTYIRCNYRVIIYRCFTYNECIIYHCDAIYC